MATHYVYEDPNKNQLTQGDVLERTPALVQLLNRYHPHYAENPNYKYFVVLTQSCDLVRRNDKPPKASYIAIAAARTLEETLIREAAKSQTPWQQEVKVIGGRQRNNLLMFLQRLFDNNEQGYFYLHTDHDLGISRSCCAVLALSVSVRSEHYDLLLDAKKAQITDTFQAKLGWLIGNLYARVGTTEWDSQYPDNLVTDATKRVLDGTLFSLSDEQIKEGLAELRQKGELDSSSPEVIFNYIREKTILSRSKKIEQRAAEFVGKIRLVSSIHGRVVESLNESELLISELKSCLLAAEVDESRIDVLANEIVGVLKSRLGRIMTDGGLPGRDEIAMAFLRGILQDSVVSSILK